MEKFRQNEFRLFAHGRAFDPDAFRASTLLKFDGVWHTGEVLPDHPKSSGIYKVLGDGQTIPLLAQEQIAIDYLTANREALQLLAQAPGVTTFILGLQYHLRPEEGLISFTLGLSLPLMRIALEIGIEPMYYVTMERNIEWQDEPDE